MKEKEICIFITKEKKRLINNFFFLTWFIIYSLKFQFLDYLLIFLIGKFATGIKVKKI